jgi:flagellar basal-body rod modification protein FlgD
MADDNTISGAAAAPKPVTPTKIGDESTAGKPVEKPKNGTLDSQGFLQLLVTQLENQDPLNPMSNEEFAVQLAQFSQLDELIGIRKAVSDKTGSVDAANPIGSMASYLGTEVVLGSDQMANKNSNVLIDVPAGTQSIRLDLTDESGTTVGQYTLEDVEAGRNVVPLKPYGLADGKYEVRVISVDSDGRFVDLDKKITGTVEGFVLEPEPRLLVGGDEIALDQVLEVHQGA